MAKNWLAIFFLMTVLSCQSQNTGQEQKLDPDAFETAVGKPDVQLLDVRTAAEFEKGHLEAAMQADWRNREEFAQRTAALSKERPVYIYCLAGPRSDAAGQWLAEKGFTIIHLKGGYAAWQRAGKPVSAATSAAPIDWEKLKAGFPADKPVLLDVGADWCPPCRQMLPIIDSLDKSAAGQYQIIRIDVSEQPLLAAKLDAESYPTFIIYRNGRETWRHVGVIGFSDLKARLGE